MRDTWLSMNRMKLSDLYSDIGGAASNYTNVDVTLHIRHLFVIGNDPSRPETMQLIRNESNLFNDILMIDTEENYKNLLYKHLALINWASFPPEHSKDFVKYIYIYIYIYSLKYIRNNFSVLPK